MNRAIFTDRDGNKIAKVFNNDGWMQNKVAARQVLEDNDNFVSVDLLGRAWEHWDEEVITTIDKEQ